MDEFAVNLPPDRVYDGYLKVLIVAQAIVAETLRKLFAMDNCLRVRFKFNADAIPHGNTIFHIEKECLHRRQP